MLPLLQVINQLGITYHVNDIFCLLFSLVFLVLQSTTKLLLFHSTASGCSGFSPNFENKDYTTYSNFWARKYCWIVECWPYPLGVLDYYSLREKMENLVKVEEEIYLHTLTKYSWFIKIGLGLLVLFLSRCLVWFSFV